MTLYSFVLIEKAMTFSVIVFYCSDCESNDLSVVVIFRSEWSLIVFDVGVMTASEITTSCLLSFFDRYKISVASILFSLN